MLERQYAGICGITQTELEANFQLEIQMLADEQAFDYQQALAELKRWYDGYLFRPGTPTFLVNFLKEAHYFIPDLDGNIERNESELEIYRAVAQDALPILFQSDYLTIKKYISDLRLYRLGFPNDEVRLVRR